LDIEHFNRICVKLGLSNTAIEKYKSEIISKNKEELDNALLLLEKARVYANEKEYDFSSMAQKKSSTWKLEKGEIQ
jgi:hypothetical protein